MDIVAFILDQTNVAVLNLKLLEIRSKEEMYT